MKWTTYNVLVVLVFCDDQSWICFVAILLFMLFQTFLGYIVFATLTFQHLKEVWENVEKKYIKKVLIKIIVQYI